MDKATSWRVKLRRTLRYTGLAERIVARLKRSRNVDFPEIGLVLAVAPEDLVIDCGANVGDLTSRFARTGATVHAFEPNPICFAILKRRFAGLSNVVLHNKGAMAERGVLPLRIPKIEGFDAVTSTVASSFLDDRVNPLHEDDRVVEVECVDFPAFVEALGRPVKLLKMDIEGSEIAVLNAMMDRGTIEKVEFAVVETHERFSPQQAHDTEALRGRIAARGLASRIRLDWV